jgi:hypothetical protein
MNLSRNRLSFLLRRFFLLVFVVAGCSAGSGAITSVRADMNTSNQYVGAVVTDGWGLVTWYKKPAPNSAVKDWKILSFVNHSFLNIRINSLYYTNNDLSPPPTLIGPPLVDTKVNPDVFLDNGTNQKIGDTIVTTWRQGSFDIVQFVYPVAFTKSGQIVVKWKIVNHSNAGVNAIEPNYLLDIDPQNDKAKVLTRWGYSPKWRVFPDPRPVPPFFMAFEHAPDDPAGGFPGLTGTGYVNDTMAPLPLGLISPVKLIIGEWTSLSYFKYGYDGPIGQDYGDNAILYMWPMTGAPAKTPKDSVTIIAGVSYGLGEFCDNYGANNPVYAMLFRPGQLSYDTKGKKYVPNPFNIEAIVFNLSSTSSFSSVNATLVVGAPLTIIPPPAGVGTPTQKTAPFNILPFDVGDAIWTVKTNDVINCNGDVESPVSLELNGIPWVDPWDCPIKVPCISTDTIAPRVDGLHLVRPGVYDKPQVGTDSCKFDVTFQVHDDLATDLGLKNISWTATNPSNFRVDTTGLNGAPWPINGCSQGKYQVTIHQIDSTKEDCLRFIFTDCANNISTADVCFCLHPIKDRPDLNPPKFELKRRYNQLQPAATTDSCNFQCSDWTVTETALYDSWLKVVAVAPGSAKNMAMSPLTGPTQPRAKTFDFTVCVTDPLLDGSITVTAIDSADHTSTLTIPYCTTRDTIPPSVKVTGIVGGWIADVTDSEDWDRGIDTVFVGGNNIRVPTPQVGIANVIPYLQDTFAVILDKSCPHTLTFRIDQADTFEAARLCVWAKDCAKKDGHSLFANVSGHSCQNIGPKLDTYSVSVDCGPSSGAPPHITVHVSDTHLTTPARDTINYDLGIDEIWFTGVYNMRLLMRNPVTGKLDTIATYDAANGITQTFPTLKAALTGLNHPKSTKDTDLYLEVANPSATDSNQACVTVWAKDFATPPHISSCTWCYYITQDSLPPLIVVDNPTHTTLDLRVRDDRINDRGVDSVWLDAPITNFKIPFARKYPAGTGETPMEVLETVKHGGSAYGVLYASDYSGKQTHQHKIPIWIYLQNLAMDAARIVKDQDKDFLVPVYLYPKDDILVKDKGLWNYKFTFHLDGSDLVKFLGPETAKSLSVGWNVTSTDNGGRSYTIEGSSPSALNPLDNSSGNDTVVFLRFHAGMSNELGLTTILIDGPDSEQVRYNGGKDTIMNDKDSNVYFVRLAAPTGTINGGKVVFQGPCTPGVKGTTTPASISIAQVSPNPADNGTQIEYTISEDGMVKLDLFNALGQHIRTLVSGEQRQGEYRLDLSASDLPEGAYLLRLESGGAVAARRLILSHR